MKSGRRITTRGGRSAARCRRPLPAYECRLQGPSHDHPHIGLECAQAHALLQRSRASLGSVGLSARHLGPFGLCLLCLVLVDACRSTASPPPPVSPVAAPQASSRAPRVGLWVLCEGSQRVLEHPGRVAGLLADARRLGVTDLFVQVYRNGRAWFDSTAADAAPFAAARDADGQDPLRALIHAAHAEGLRVHAWVNVLSLGSNREAPVLKDLGPAAVQVDRRGRSMLDYPQLELPAPDSQFLRLGTPALWLDPGAPGVAERLAGTFAELAARYPELDGLHLDYIRHPDVLPFSPGSRFDVGLDYGYGAATRARFAGQTGLPAPLGPPGASANAWDGWRREQVTALVRAIRDAVRREQPTLVLSAAVWPFPERSYFSVYQDWPGWLDDGLLDFAVPMLYTTDDRFFLTELRAYHGIASDRIWVGLGSWLFADAPDRAANQLHKARAAGLAGVSLFSHDAFAEHPALLEALVDQPIRER